MNDDDDFDKVRREMMTIIICWLLFIGGAVSVALFIFGRWVGVW